MMGFSGSCCDSGGGGPQDKVTKKKPEDSTAKKHGPTAEEIRKVLLTKMMDDSTKRIFYSSCTMLLLSKGLAVASPLFLKEVIDMMSLGTNINSTTLLLGIGGFGITKLLSTCFHEYRMYQIGQFIQQGIRRINH